MPPRYVYWTIIVDGQPTAFRSGSLEDIMPTFNRLKEKQPTAELKWFQNGQLFPSRHDAQEFMRARGDRGRERDPRQAKSTESSFAKATEDKTEGKPERAWNAKPEWRTRTSFSPASAKAAARPAPGDKPAWVPKGDASSQREGSSGDEKPSFVKATANKPVDKPAWKPRGSFKPKEAGHSSGWDDKSAWKPKGDSDRPAGQARGSKPPTFAKATADKPEWKPKGTFKPKEAGHSSGWGEKPGWKAKSEKPSFARASEDRPGKPAWKAKTGGSAREQARSSFRPKSYTPKGDDDRSGGKAEWTPRGSSSAKPSTFAKATADKRASSRERSEKLDWKPKSADPRPQGPNAGFAKSDPDAPKRKWVPKAEYKKSLGIEVKRDDKWRPGGEHVDPKQKYKDAKKAKWTRVKATIRARSAKPRKRED